MLTVGFGQFTMSRTQFQLWYNNWFKEVREDVNDDTSLVEIIEAVKKVILNNRCITINQVGWCILHTLLQMFCEFQSQTLIIN